MNNVMKCFAASNTNTGFESFFDEMLNDQKYVYIIKGGPGTGKSVFMKEISKTAQKLSYSVSEIYCSSDPLSLDALIINELSIALVDGTAPHVREPGLAGVKDEILNFGSFWNKNHLQSHKDEIIDYSAKKAADFKKLYAYLYGIEKLNKEKESTVIPFINKEKISSYIKRLLKQYPNGRQFSKKRLQIRAYSMKGHVYLDTFESISDTVYSVEDNDKGVANIFFKLLLEELKEKKLNVIYSSKDINISEISDIYLPDLGVAFVSNCKEYYKKINCERFLDKEKYRSVKNNLKFINGVKKSLENKTDEIFKEISVYHGELEKIYIKAMDFKMLDIFRNTISEEIFNKQ